LKTAFVTGASAGIGAATAKQLLKDGYKVYAGARRIDQMAELAALGARLLRLDLTDDGSIVSCMATIRSEARRLDVLVNNAGYGLYGAVEDVPMQDARRQFEVNLFGAARLIQLAAPIMRAQGQGAIINIAAMRNMKSEAFTSWYQASKFALIGLSKNLKIELEPFGVRVLVLNPDAAETDWHRNARRSLVFYSHDGDFAAAANDVVLAQENDEILNRYLPPSAVAKLVSQMISDVEDVEISAVA
jgi:NAD(P)-dependent dehydrogenase (short-subunit alcohol dehydrogenase family)